MRFIQKLDGEGITISIELQTELEQSYPKLFDD